MAPLAAVEASAGAAVEAAAGLLLSTAALAADSLAAVLSPTEFGAEVITRAAHCYRAAATAMESAEPGDRAVGGVGAS